MLQGIKGIPIRSSNQPLNLLLTSHSQVKNVAICEVLNMYIKEPGLFSISAMYQFCDPEQIICAVLSLIFPIFKKGIIISHRAVTTLTGLL